jgi:Zn ribbon nucleic-acid-binding protein
VSTRERDYSYEAMCEVCGMKMDEITKDERGRVNAALKQLRELHSDDYLLADMIFDRAKLYQKVYEGMPVTPQALAGNWSQLPVKAEDLRKTQIVQTNVYAGGDCDVCGGDKMVLYSTRPAPVESEGHVLAFEEMAPCPNCNASADAGFWRADGTRFRPPDPAQVRERIK